MLGPAERLAQRALAEPAAPMLADLARHFTVADVAARAAGVAEVLVEAVGDVPAGYPVLVLADRSLESVITMLGVLWAGAALVPVDASDADARLSTTAAQVRATVALSPRRSTMRSVDGVRVVDVSAMRSGTSAPRVPLPGAAAVILTTSGSSGRPKAVLRTSEQTAIAQERAVLDPHQSARGRSAVFLPPFYGWGFVELVLETCAGRFALLVDIQTDEPDLIAAAIERWDIERLAVTPSLARLLPSLFGWTRGLAEVHTVFLGGEPVSWPDITAVRSLIASDGVVWVAYGASELLIQTHRFRVGPDLVAGEQPLALGYPLVPECCVVKPTGDHPDHGELVVYDLVAECYLGDPETTAERFGVDASGRRFWRTGDIIDVSADGLARYCGRVDDMVKINGRLVEPAEAELVLRNVPGIRIATVLPRTLASGRHQLVAHVETDASVSAVDVRRIVERELPTHLVPAVIVHHDALPVTERGKVDRGALHSAPVVPWRDHAESGELPYRLGAPVLGIVSRILELPDLSPDDVLWDVGCDSLAAIEIASEVVTAFGSKLAPNDLVTARTVREICERIAAGGVGQRSFAIEYHSAGTLPPIFMVPGAGSPALSLHLLISGLGEDQPVVVLERRGLHQFQRADRTLRAVVKRNLAEMRQRQPHGPYLLLGRSFGGIVAHEMAVQLLASGEPVTLVLIDTHRNLTVTPRGRRQRPERLRTRVDVWPLYVAKLIVWRTAIARRWIRERVLGHGGASAGPVGSVARYDSFAGIDHEILRCDLRPVIDAPVWFIHPRGSGASGHWLDHPQLTVVETGGDHFTMVNPPNTDIIVAAIREAARGGCRSDAECQHPHVDPRKAPR